MWNSFHSKDGESTPPSLPFPSFWRGGFKGFPEQEIAKVSESWAVGSQQERWHCPFGGCACPEITQQTEPLRGPHTKEYLIWRSPASQAWIRCWSTQQKDTWWQSQQQSWRHCGISLSGPKEHWEAGSWAGAGKKFCQDSRAPRPCLNLAPGHLEKTTQGAWRGARPEETSPEAQLRPW